jgi:hypothetical protein
VRVRVRVRVTTEEESVHLSTIRLSEPGVRVRARASVHLSTIHFSEPTCFFSREYIHLGPPTHPSRTLSRSG